ncbi:MAG: hypothetical protein ACOYNG_01390 [Terrimicrobiaceae bacterium]
MTLRALLLFLCSAPLLAAVGTSANYTLAVGTLDGGGCKGVAANYEIDFSMGPGESAASLNTLSRTGFAGELMDPVALEIDRSAAPWSFNEQTTRQLAAHLLLDDDTLQALAAAEVYWSIVSGPIAELGATGNATAAAVYQDTPAVVGASHAGFSSTRAFSILNVGNDDFGTYAADGLSDLWQVGYFGENNVQAGQATDADGDGLKNLQEFAFGTHPLLSNSRPVAWSGVVLQQRGLPLPSVEPSGDAFSFRAVFSRRKDREAVGLAYSVEFSGDLATWQTSTSTPTAGPSPSPAPPASIPMPVCSPSREASVALKTSPSAVLAIQP